VSDEERGPVDRVRFVRVAYAAVPAPMTAPITARTRRERAPAASSTRPAHAATKTLLTTATIPATVSVSCHALGDAEHVPRTATM
jgi:hypothetical protein